MGSLSLANDVYVEAYGNVWMPFNQITATDMNIISGAGVIFDSNVATHTGTNYRVTATLDGIIDTTSASVTFAATGAYSILTMGTLGSQGGRYVLEDFFLNAFYDEPQRDRVHKINQNTMGQEYVAKSGFMDLLSATQRILFYGSPLVYSSVIQPPGSHLTHTSWVQRTDYCA